MWFFIIGVVVGAGSLADLIRIPTNRFAIKTLSIVVRLIFLYSIQLIKIAHWQGQDSNLHETFSLTFLPIMLPVFLRDWRLSVSPPCYRLNN